MISSSSIHQDDLVFKILQFDEMIVIIKQAVLESGKEAETVEILDDKTRLIFLKQQIQKKKINSLFNPENS